LFSSLFFILLAIVIISFASEFAFPLWSLSAWDALAIGLLAYAVMLSLVYLQVRYLSFWKKGKSNATLLFIVNLEWLAFLCLFHFGIGAHRIWLESDLFHSWTTFLSLFSLTLYLVGLGWHHFCVERFLLHQMLGGSLSYAWLQIQFLLPFCLPFITLSFLFDGINFIFPSLPFAILALLSLTFLVLTLLFLPPLIVNFWHCKPLPLSHLKNRIDALCRTLRFKHGGIKLWTVMRHHLTAGIIGVLPRFRYIMLTPSLIGKLSTEEIEAIIAHEIGHNRYKHLLLYPFILLGMMISAALFFIFSSHYLFSYFSQLDQKYPSELWTSLFSFSLFVSYALILALYFRFIFGFFSRLFERQADLHIFECPTLSPYAMIQALDHIATASGYTHKHPSWHHFSIEQRMSFLALAIDHPHVIGQHHRKVKKWLVIYFFCLLWGSTLLFYLI
jgi:Zn-dependent protease with chaperone function